MAKSTQSRRARQSDRQEAAPKRRRFRPFRWMFRWLMRLVFGAIAVVLLAVLAVAAIDPPLTPYMYQERQRLGEIRSDWVDLDDIAPVMARSAVAAEDANFCQHWGLDLDAIRQAMEEGAVRGASTISQQTVKNVYLWHGRSYLRKAIEAVLTPVVEAVWSKRRILEVYLNVAEFDEGVFGVQAAAQHYFGVDAASLSTVQAARLAAILPDPKGRSASDPSAFVRSRAASIQDGAATIRADGRAACFDGDRD